MKLIVLDENEVICVKIELETVQNSRDLGGLTTPDGSRLKMGRVLRTANMSMLNQHDIDLLRSYDLRLVLDFRTQTVINATPNVKIEGVEYVHIPIVKDLNSRVMSKGDYESRTMADILLTFSQDFCGKGVLWMRDFYKNLYSSDYSLSQYKIFLDYMKNNTQGAVIFHCTAGKDRTGVGAILFLTALGIDREQIICDYLETNKSVEADIRATEALGREKGVSQCVIDDIAKINGVLREYADAVFSYIDTYPTPEDFFKDKMGIDKTYLAELRENYLE